MSPPDLIVDVPASAVSSVRYSAAFPFVLKAILGEGYKIASIAETAALRAMHGAPRSVGEIGHFVSEGFLYRHNEKTRVVRTSPLISSSDEAHCAHINQKEFYINENQLEACLQDSIELPEDGRISVRRFDSDPFAIWAFGGERGAREYGEFLTDLGVKSLSIVNLSDHYVSKDKGDGNHGKPFVRQAFFDRPSNSSTISGDFYSTHIQTWRGIKNIY